MHWEDLLTFPWVSFALVGCQGRTEAAAGEHGHPDEGFGAVVAVGPFRQCPDVGVRGFRPAVRSHRRLHANARTEGYYRLVKEPANSARRIRFHCTRTQRAATQTSC